jgi:hypothetical protein
MKIPVRVYVPLLEFNPYRTDHINRFGSYELKFDQVAEPIAEGLQL